MEKKDNPHMKADAGGGQIVLAVLSLNHQFHCMAKNQPYTFDEFLNLVNESDRGCVLVAGSNLDERMASLHKVFIRSTAELTEKQYEELFEWPGPISSFSSRIKIAYFYGVISKPVYADLLLIKNIRNRAAHSTAKFTFHKHANEIAKFKAHDRIVKGNPNLVPLSPKLVKQEDFPKTQFVLNYMSLDLELTRLENNL